MLHVSMFRGVTTALLTLAATTAIGQGAEQVIRVVPPAEPKILDPIWTTSSSTRNHGYMIYDTLFGIDGNRQVQPQMVEAYSVSPDAKIWTFTLRDGLLFSDGAPVKTSDVIASLTRWAKRDAAGQKMLARMERFDAVDDNTFRMIFAEPFGMVTEILAKTSANVPFIMPERVAKTSPDKQIDDLTGSGPFTLAKSDFRPGDRVIYRRNPLYKPRSEAPSGTAGGKRVYVDRVEWVALKDAQTQVNALMTGAIDVIEYAPAEHFATLRDSPQTELVQVLPPQMMTVHFNHLAAPFDNPKVVKAAMLAINQAAMLRAQTPDAELYRVCPSIYPCSLIAQPAKSTWFTGKPQFEQARALLKEAGYDGEPVVVMQPTDQVLLNKYPMVYAQLLRTAGFTVNVQAMDWGTLIARRAQKNTDVKERWNVFVTGWSASDAMHPLFYPPLTGTGADGYFGWPSESQMEQAKAELVATSDPGQRARLLDDIGRQALDAGVIGPIGEMNVFTAVRRGALTGLLKGDLGVYWNARTTSSTASN